MSLITLFMGLKTIAPKALQQLIDQQQVSVYDVNAQHSWARARVPGARLTDHARFSADELPADRQAELVFYCSNPLCRKAPLAARRALSMGYRNVRVMAAGISGWISARLPVESGEG
jgi:rhodanese-related sulfurtransferase